MLLTEVTLTGSWPSLGFVCTKGVVSTLIGCLLFRDSLSGLPYAYNVTMLLARPSDEQILYQILGAFLWSPKTFFRIFWFPAHFLGALKLPTLRVFRLPFFICDCRRCLEVWEPAGSILFFLVLHRFDVSL